MKTKITTKLQEIASNIETVQASNKSELLKAFDLNHLLGKFYAYAEMLRELSDYDSFCAELDNYDPITSDAATFCEEVYNKYEEI